MLEYSLVTWLLIVALVLGCTVRMIPGAQRQESIVGLFFKALQIHYDSFYLVLNSGLP
jgi:hypothetical protein